MTVQSEVAPEIVAFREKNRTAWLRNLVAWAHLCRMARERGDKRQHIKAQRNHERALCYMKESER